LMTSADFSYPVYAH